MTEIIRDKRVYVGGLTHLVSADDIRGRFKPFGRVQSVEFPGTNYIDGRGFSYVNLQITDSQWRRCMSLYTGSKWKGGKLKVEEAKLDYMARLQQERDESKRDQEESAKVDERAPEERLLERKKRMYASPSTDGISVEDLSLVTDKNFKRYEGWSKGRYGRPVLKYMVVRPCGRKLRYDPVRYKNSFERLTSEASPVEHIQWEYDGKAAAEDFEQAKKLPQDVVDMLKSSLKRYMEPSEEEEEEHNQKKLRKQQSLFEMEESSDEEGYNVVPPMDEAYNGELMGDSAQLGVPNPEVEKRLADGVFDSDSEDDVETTQRSTKPHATEDNDLATDSERIALERERNRTSAILSQLLGSIDQESPQDGGNSSNSQDKKQKQSKQSENTKSNKPSKDSDSDDSSGDDSTSGSGSGSNDDGSSSGDGDGNQSESTSSSDSDSDSDSDSEDESDGEMEVDDDRTSKNELKDIFGKNNDNSGGLFGSSSSGFKFTEALGLEEDEAPANVQNAQEMAPTITGHESSTVATGPSGRNLNANRLPPFFPDVDSPMFRKPEPTFMRQKTEEELEAEWEKARPEMTKEYKAQARSAARKAQKMRDRRAPGARSGGA